MTERNPYAPPLSVVKDIDGTFAQGSLQRVEYKNTFLALFRYNISHQFRMPLLQAFVLLCAGFISFQAYQRSTLAVSAVVAIVGYVVLWSVQIIFIFLQVLFTKRKTLTNWHAITLTDEGLLEESQFGRTLTFWSGGSLEVRRLAGYIAIYVTPLSAHLVPMRAFRTKEDAARFQHGLEQKIRAAKP